MKKRILIIFLIILLLTICTLILLRNYKNINVSNYEIISTYNKPIIPSDFKSIDTENAKWDRQENGEVKDWNKGLVIEDDKGNQFVWVPVNLDNLHYDSYYLLDSVQYKKELLDIQNEEEAQILKYGGFYVARYEAGVPEKMQDKLDNISSDTNNIIGVPVSKKDCIPWNYISPENAKESARSMYQLNNIKSDLLTERQWQAIMQWLNGCNYNVYSSSSGWGNYCNVSFSFSGYYSEDHGRNYQYSNKKVKQGNNMILSCGATDRNMANNIYDLAGNLREYLYSFPESGYNAKGGYYDYLDQGAYGGGM